ncbi:gluconate 2-dehydrogenase subunit 3 family protein [Thalassomonas haliotis]|uniref:Gluconate 2-dehydrogenase subunit 3 family protein n=1 Tax=Thalassomonas haliotis TaxID=485448 RepID=A0ABY7V9N5_9GAMM|nr:gluconate 2-dehydrogenase subunit 3 family protein [Thalassomonas haliotis]WDE10288.1 gluconate 2-dehydrogenase subunit 3 family protein [Thalassomonas haliotis]
MIMKAEQQPQVPKNKTRRDFIRQLTLTLGSATAAGLVAGSGLSVALAYSAKPEIKNKPGLIFTRVQLNLLARVCDTILPRTDTPSGSELDCHGFADHQLFHCFQQKQQQQCCDILDTIAKQSRQTYRQEFEQLPQQEQTALLLDIEKSAGFTSKDKTQFKFLKALLVFGYFTSEAGATQVLNYQAIPGGYLGSIPYDENSKAWGSLAYY